MTGTSRSGGGLSKAKLDKVFAKAPVHVSGSGGSEIRKDAAGTLIQRQSYGEEGRLAWEVDHIKPRARGGSNALDNLQPLHPKNNQSKGTGRSPSPKPRKPK